jgi:hypothetical protein
MHAKVETEQNNAPRLPAGSDLSQRVNLERQYVEICRLRKEIAKLDRQLKLRP